MLKQESGLVFIETQGYSMWPFLKAGEKLIVKRMPRDAFCRGDLILYRQSEKFICHRLIKMDESFCYVRGDAAWGRPEEIRFDSVIGKVSGILRINNKVINMSSARQRLLNQMRILALPLLYIANKAYVVVIVNRRSKDE